MTEVNMRRLTTASFAALAFVAVVGCETYDYTAGGPPPSTSPAAEATKRQLLSMRKVSTISSFGTPVDYAFKEDGSVTATIYANSATLTRWGKWRVQEDGKLCMVIPDTMGLTAWKCFDFNNNTLQRAAY